jgi:catechol 2,3-dioxygenase-like lactoylglutathione lyase family enzyme
VRGFRRTLDHVVVVVRDLDAASASYARLGFRLTPRSSHKGALEPGGPVEPWGSGNHCAMFHDGYLEILGVTDPDRYHDHVTDRLRRHAGLCLIALGCDDLAAAAKDLRSRVAGVKDDLVELQRDAPSGESARLARFRFAFLEPETFPEGDLFYIEHLTPEVLWQASLLDHPNGVTALAGVTICSGDRTATGKRLQAILGVRPEPDGEGLRFALDRGWIEVVGPAGLARRFKDARPPAIPSIAATAFTVADLGATLNFLEARGIEVRDAKRESVWVGPEAAEGAIVEFLSA